ncbi:putative transcriptional regulatory [Hyphodiscus hymeniophilus]|uniref:Transcriptional regulatory n=1 Tax=Hyphodiscus hymeniophilus TaxID=353542 RepID=A0A9P6VEJ1_9HELO|nr:putative transcriptional regulatory [Hyphodiscus hymeniophilus]
MTQIYTRPLIAPIHERSSSYGPRTVNKAYSSQECRTIFIDSGLNQPHARSIGEPRSPMYEHEKVPFGAPLPKVGEMYTKRPEMSQNPPREQLPPLSSLFGSSSSHPIRPAQSPYSDRHSPVFPAVSPLDAHQPATPLHAERSYDTSYFQRPGASRQYSYNSKPEPGERLGLPSASRPTPAGGRPESPRYEYQYGAMDTPRSQHPSGWSPRSVASAPDYFARDTSSSFRPLSEHRPHTHQSHRPEQDSRLSHHDQARSTTVTSNYIPTPASTVAGEPSTTKDGLGPKIWTGTQFLPRFVRQAEVQGEGMCYFYDDGTHCKTVIDGEIVNAHWGVTKAGRPRKRLAIACITCREKKIKCDPDYPRCVQCEKFGRICKFKNAPRGGQGSPDTPPADPEDLIPRPLSSRTDNELFKIERSENSPSVSPRQTLRRATPESDAHPAKRQRTGYADFTPVASEASPQVSVLEPTSPSKVWLDTVNSPIEHNVLRDWQVNPYTTQPALITELIAVFFKHIPDTAYCMLPEGPFTAWALTGSEKSLDDLMLIYTVLAFGTLFSSKPEHRELGVRYSSISRYACDNRHFSLQLVQARMILAMYYFAVNNPNDSWDACGAAVRAASGLRLNIEFEKSEDSHLKTFPYGLNRAGYAECRRRTFWCCYLMDRFNGFCSGNFSIIQPEDVFLRLPCDSISFESQRDVQNPYFDPSCSPIQNTNWTVGSMAYLINICTIWGEVMAHIYRTTQQPVPATNNTAFTTFYETATLRLHAWKDSLPTCYQYTTESLQKASRNGRLGTFMTMHTVYHTTAMKLNRYMQHSTLSTSQIAHHISVAQQHAETLMAILETLTARRTPLPIPNVPGELSKSTNKLSSPFVGYSIISAIDILTARVTLATLPARLSSFSGALSILADLASFWQSARTQQALVLQRVRDLTQLAGLENEHGGAGAIGFQSHNVMAAAREVREGVFDMREPMEKTFARDYDCVYA